MTKKKEKQAGEATLIGKSLTILILILICVGAYYVADAFTDIEEEAHNIKKEQCAQYDKIYDYRTDQCIERETAPWLESEERR